MIQLRSLEDHEVADDVDGKFAPDVVIHDVWASITFGGGLEGDDVVAVAKAAVGTWETTD